MFVTARQSLTFREPVAYKARRSSDEYIDFLESCGVDSAEIEKLYGCHSAQFRLYDCPDADRHLELDVKMFVPIGCKSKYCAVCRSGRINREVQAIVQEMKECFDAYGMDTPHFLFFDGTMPDDMQRRITEYDVRRLRLVMWETLCEQFGGLGHDSSAFHALRDCKTILGCEIVVQLDHSSEPLSRGWFPHVHAVVSSLAFDSCGKAVQIPYFLKPHELASLKEIWARRLQSEFGASSYHGIMDFYYQYGKSYKDLGHRLSYMNRSMTHDVNFMLSRGFEWHYCKLDEALRAKKAGENVCIRSPTRCYIARKIAVEKLNKLWISRLLDTRRHSKGKQWFGWMASNVRRKFIQSLGVVYVSRVQRIKSLNKIFCPAHVKRDGRWVTCNTILEASDVRISFDELLKASGHAVILVGEHERHTVLLKSFDDIPIR